MPTNTSNFADKQLFHKQQETDSSKLITALLRFMNENLTLLQKRQIIKITGDEQLFVYLVSSYNCYEILHSKGQMRLITNPEMLCQSADEMSALMEIVKKFTKQIMEQEKAEKEYGKQCASYRRKE